ncbi:MAG: hypothetical protein HZB91_06780 [Elusimicrobia bacterium]|nr:hypothetical protein [Elusimicrobiota bacterium]
MQDIIRWADDFKPAAKPWLILGMGPTFQRVRETDISGYHTCSLNYVVREMPVTLAHFIDISGVLRCADSLHRNARFLVLPYRPHVDHKPGRKTIHDFVAEIPALQKLAKEDRLLWYNLSSSRPIGGSPTIKVRFFSVEAALNLLVACGVRTVRSLGVDGGTSYGRSFTDLKDKTLLANGHPSFDRQFQGICATLRHTSDLLYAPLHMDAPIRVFIGADASRMMRAKMLEYSIKKFTPVTVKVQPLLEGSPEAVRIPELCGYRGRGIYLDADTQVLSDLTKLWLCPMEKAAILSCRRPGERHENSRRRVMLMDCEALSRQDGGNPDCVEETMPLPAEWDPGERSKEDGACIIDFGGQPTQPWVSNEHARSRLWYDNIREAIQEGFLTREELYEEIRANRLPAGLPRWAGLHGSGVRGLLKICWRAVKGFFNP